VSTSNKSNPVKNSYPSLFPDEFDQVRERNSIAFLPLGALEYHGHHMVLGMDSLKAEKLCTLVATKVGGVVLPALNLGVDLFPNLDTEEFPNKRYDCYHLPPELYTNILARYYQNLQKIGFEKVFVMVGHYPNAEYARSAAENLKLEVIVFNEAELADMDGDHAGKWETSIMMSLFPEYVDLSKMEGKDEPLLAIAGESPVHASKRYGDKYVQIILERIIELLG